MNTSLSSFINYIIVYKQAKDIKPGECVYISKDEVHLISKVKSYGSSICLTANTYKKPVISKLVWASDTYKVKTPVDMESFHP